MPEASVSVEAARLLRATELATFLAVSKRKAFEIMASGTIPVVTLGPRCRRVRLADAVEWADARRRAS